MISDVPALNNIVLTLFDPTSDLVRQYDVPVLLRCRKTSDTVFVAFARSPSKPVRRFSARSTDFNQQVAQVVLFLFLRVLLF
jgi:GMP synthase PP-ATPase subunit